MQAGRYSEAAQALEEAITAFRVRGDLSGAARTMLALAVALRQPGDQRQWSLPAEARELLEPLGPSADLVAALTEVAGQ